MNSSRSSENVEELEKIFLKEINTNHFIIDDSFKDKIENFLNEKIIPIKKKKKALSFDEKGHIKRSFYIKLINFFLNNIDKINFDYVKSLTTIYHIFGLFNKANSDKLIFTFEDFIKKNNSLHKRIAVLWNIFKLEKKEKIIISDFNILKEAIKTRLLKYIDDLARFRKISPPEDLKTYSKIMKSSLGTLNKVFFNSNKQVKREIDQILTRFKHNQEFIFHIFSEISKKYLISEEDFIKIIADKQVYDYTSFWKSIINYLIKGENIKIQKRIEFFKNLYINYNKLFHNFFEGDIYNNIIENNGVSLSIRSELLLKLEKKEKYYQKFKNYFSTFNKTEKEISLSEFRKNINFIDIDFLEILSNSENNNWENFFDSLIIFFFDTNNEKENKKRILEILPKFCNEIEKQILELFNLFENKNFVLTSKKKEIPFKESFPVFESDRFFISLLGILILMEVNKVQKSNIKKKYLIHRFLNSLLNLSNDKLDSPKINFKIKQIWKFIILFENTNSELYRTFRRYLNALNLESIFVDNLTLREKKTRKTIKYLKPIIDKSLLILDNLNDIFQELGEIEKVAVYYKSIDLEKFELKYLSDNLENLLGNFNNIDINFLNNIYDDFSSFESILETIFLQVNKDNLQNNSNYFLKKENMTMFEIDSYQYDYSEIYELEQNKLNINESTSLIQEHFHYKYLINRKKFLKKFYVLYKIPLLEHILFFYYFKELYKVIALFTEEIDEFRFFNTIIDQLKKRDYSQLNQYYDYLKSLDQKKIIKFPDIILLNHNQQKSFLFLVRHIRFSKILLENFNNSFILFDEERKKIKFSKFLTNNFLFEHPFLNIGDRNKILIKYPYKIFFYKP